MLVVDNNREDAEVLVRDLRRHGYEGFRVSTGKQALSEHERADFVVLDLELPDMDGLAVCREIRTSSTVPIVALTCRGTELDRVLGLQAGSDDCISRPFGLRELIARMEAVLRRVSQSVEAPQIITRGYLEVDCRMRQVHLRGRLIELTRKEFELLRILISQPDSVVSREQLMAKVWDDLWAKNGRTIDTHVSSLRSKLGSSTWITTVRGVGYRIGYE